MPVTKPSCGTSCGQSTNTDRAVVPGRIKTAVIGCGKVAHFHAKAYNALPGSDFAAACHLRQEKAEAFAAEYGVRAYSDIGRMVRECGIQLASICTPHPAHASGAVEAIENGAHVLIEKPLAASLADCDRILKTAQRNGVKVGVACQRRFYRPSLRIREAPDVACVCGAAGNAPPCAYGRRWTAASWAAPSLAR